MLAPLVSALVHWLQNPEIHISVSNGEDVQQLLADVERYQSQVDDLMFQLQRVQSLYAQECALNISLEDSLRALGVRRGR